MNLLLPGILGIFYLIVVGMGLWLAFTLVSAVVRISHAFASMGRSLEVIAAKYNSTDR